MKLVFVTQVLDRQDAVLGFVSRWVSGLAAHAESVRVIALEVGDTGGLPPNVDWVALGRRGKLWRYLRYRRELLRGFGEGFDGLLTHMVPRYSTVAAPFARRAGVPHYLWYTHKGVDRRLLAALEVVDGAFTASPESLRVDTPKKIVTGHGIDAQHFDVAECADADGTTRLLSVGRLTPAKDPLTVLEAIARLRGDGRDVTLTWAGAALARGDDAYVAMVEDAITGSGLEGAVQLLGAVPYPEVPRAYERADLFVNASRTGSVDKVVLEAMAARRPFVSCNESIPPLLRGDRALRESAESFEFVPGDAASLAGTLSAWMDEPLDVRRRVGRELRALVERDHDVDRLMGRLVRTIAASGGRE